jgi:hypothetical protein
MFCIPGQTGMAEVRFMFVIPGQAGMAEVRFMFVIPAQAGIQVEHLPGPAHSRG